MKFYYASQKMTKGDLDDLLTFYQRQEYLLPDFSKYQPRNLDLQSECPLVPRADGDSSTEQA